MPVNSASFYGASRGPIGGRSDYALDPRRIMAIELMKNGASTAPVQSPLEGLAKALQAGVGGYFARDAKLEQDKEKAAYGQDMAKVLAGGNAQPWVNPDTGKPQGTAGGFDGMAAALSGIENPDVQASMGPQITMGRMQQQQAAADRAEADRMARERFLFEQKNKAPPTPVAGRDTPLAPEVFNQQVAIAGARADASRETPEQAAARAGAVKAAETKATAESGVVKPVPVPVMKLERDDRDAMNTTETINDNLTRYIDQIDKGTLDFGMIANKQSELLNATGMSTKSSRNFASFMSGLEKLRNDSLRLNAGVQTDGDAKRAWDELVKNINDPKVVKQRLGEILQINKRGAALKADNLEQIYSQYPGLRPKKDKEAEQPASPAAPNVDDLLKKYGGA